MKIIIAVIAVVLLGACAHAPKVSHVPEAGGATGNPGVRAWESSRSPYRVYYALPRTVLEIPVALKLRHVEAGVLPGDYADQCKESLNSHIPDARGCFWKFRKPQPPPGSLFMCQAASKEGTNAADVYAYIDDPLAVTVRAEPDLERVYQVDLRQPLFQRYKADLTLSESFSPLGLLATSTSIFNDMATVVRSLSTFQLRDGSTAFLIEERGKENTEFMQIVERMNQLEASRLELMSVGKPIDPIEGELSRLRSRVQGRVVERSFPGRMVFTTTSEQDKSIIGLWQRNGATGVEQVVAGHALEIDACGNGALITPILQLKPEMTALGMLRWQDAVTDESSVDGFRYRSPLWVNGSLRFNCPNSDAITTSQCKSGRSIPLTEAIPFAQWGVVRSLPRRLGFGSGEISASFDPATGALRKVGSKGEGIGRGLIMQAIEEATADAELANLKRNAEIANFRSTICEKADVFPDRPLPDYCSASVEGDN